MYNDLFSIGPVTIHGYGLMIGIGFIVGLFVGEWLAKKKGIESDNVVSLAIWILVLGFLAGKLLFIITEIPDIIAGNTSIIAAGNGFVVYGGIIAALPIGLIYCKKKKISFLSMGDCIAPATAVVQGFGRIGCFLAGCCWGREAHGNELSITFTNSAYAPNGIPLVPTQLYSSALNFLNFILLYIIFKKEKHEGEAFACYVIFYAVGRFFIEFLRDDPRGAVGALSTSQFISIFMAIFGICFLIFVRKHGKAVVNTKNDDVSTAENN